MQTDRQILSLDTEDRSRRQRRTGWRTGTDHDPRHKQIEEDRGRQAIRQTQVTSLDTDRSTEEDREMKIGWHADTDHEPRHRQSDRGRQTDEDGMEYRHRFRI